MSPMKILFCAIVCILQLNPSQSGIIEILFDVPVSILDGVTRLTLGCPSPDRDVCPNSNIHYYLYTKDTQDSPYELNSSLPETLTNANFTQGVPLKVIIHGYTGDKDFPPNKELRPAYFEKGEYNIITVDWGVLARNPCYIQAAKNVELVGKCAAQFLDTLYEARSDVTLENTHVLGFSLGAHVAGRLGDNLKTGKLPRVTGLDPALPLFDDVTSANVEMLSSEAGQFVDVYHSNAGYKGKKDSCGHVDVYFNNGESQPGCNCTSGCDHLRSVLYYTEAINSPVGLWGFPCDNWRSYVGGSCNVNSTEEVVEFGESISTSLTHGIYMAFTNSTSPFLLASSEYVEDSDLADKVYEKCSVINYIF